eukprot:g16615.t1
MRWGREAERPRPAAGATTIAGTDPESSAAQVMDDPMESFSPVTDNAQDGAILRDDVPDIIANKIQKHHELWYQLAYGRPRDRRPITSIDYGNADEVVLSHTQESDGDLLKAEDELPDGSPKFLIHPYDKRKVVWDLFVATLILYGCINIPLRIGFDLPSSLGQIITDAFIDVCFLLDVILSFRTAYLAPDGEPVTNPGDIAIRYLKGSFLIDLCSTVPVDLIMLLVGGMGGLLRSTKLLRTLRLLRLARLLKLSSIGGNEDDLKNYLHPSLWALIKMFVSLIFIAHVMGCMWNWLTILRTTVGYGDITSASDVERGFAIVGMIIGATVFGYIIGNVAVIMENFNVVDAIENGKMNQIKEWLYDRKFPPALADKIRRQYRYIFTEVGVFDNSEIVDIMPGVMSTSLLYAQHRAVAKGVGFLAKRPPVLVARLLRKMVPSFANSGDVLFLEHEVGGHWYLLRSGAVAFYVSVSPWDTQSEVLLMRTLSDDGHFGLAPVLLNILNNETATATTAVEMVTIRKDDLVDILRQWPEVMAELTTEAESHFREVKVSEVASDIAIDGVNAGFDAATPRPGGDDTGSKDVQSVFFRATESKDIEAAHNAEDIVDGSTTTAGAIAGATNVAVEATEILPAASEHLVAASTEEVYDGDEEDGGARSITAGGERLDRARNNAREPRHVDSSSLPPLLSDDVDTVRGEGEEGVGKPNGGGILEGEPAAARAAEAMVVADGIGPNDSQRSTETVADNAAAAMAAAATAAKAATTPVAAPRGRTAEHLRPPPIVTEEVPPILHSSSSEMMDRAGGGEDSNGDADESGSVDPEQMRRCFVAKTFSPSDLGFGAMRHDGDDEAGNAVQEALTKESLMRARRRRRTIQKGITGIEGRRHTVDEVLGLDDPQAVLGSLPPERLFSITGMFHPEATVKVSWDLWLSMVIIWSVLEVTYRLGFDRPAQDGWVVLAYCVDALFFTDMLISLRTALVKRDGEVVANQKQVALAYLQGWFVIDLVSTVPWDLLVLKIAVGDPNAATSTKLVRALRLVRLVRLIRLLKIPDFMEEWEDNSPLGPSSVKLGRLLVLMAFSAHINACIWYAAGLHTASERNWIADYYCAVDDISSDCPNSKESFSLYLTSIYFAFTTMTTTGYGDILPNGLSKLELVVAIASEVLGATIFAWVIGNLVNLVLNLNPAERNRKSMMNYLTEYIREVPLNSKAKQAMARNYAFHLQIHSVFNQPSILGDLLPHLQNQAYMFLWRSLMPKLPFFCAMEDQVTGFVRVVLPFLKPATFALGEIIVTPKVGTREMGFITSGEVEVRLAKGRRNFKTTTIGERKHFGEMFMLLPEHVPFRGLAQVRANTRVRMMVMTRTALSTLEDRHPHISDFMAKQLYEPDRSPLWVVVNADFQSEVDKLEANTMVSDSSTLETPRSPEGSFLEPVDRHKLGSTVTTPGGSIRMRKRAVASRSPSSSPIGVAAPREPAMRQAVGVTKASRMANASGRALPPHGR